MRSRLGRGTNHAHAPPGRGAYHGHPGKPNLLTLAVTSTVILVTAVLAAWFPAHRAGKADPMIALRAE